MTASLIRFLEWFDENEREVCAVCGERARVEFHRLGHGVCLACNAVEIGGETVQPA